MAEFKIKDGVAIIPEGITIIEAEAFINRYILHTLTLL